MAKRNQLGFTLVELIIAMAISGLLAVIAFQGQRQLRSQAQFDAFVEKVLASIDNAHNQATAGVNFAGLGNGSVSCNGTPVTPGRKYMFAGVVWSATNSTPATMEMNFYATEVIEKTSARTAAQPCIFNTEGISVIPGLAVNPPGLSRQHILFVRDDTGGIVACRATAAPASLRNSFRTGACAAPAVPIGAAGTTMLLTDPNNHRSTIFIDQSGLAKRLN